MSETELYPRRIARHLIESLEYSPVVLIHGPRQCGKTTLAQAVCAPEILKSRKNGITRGNPPLGKAAPGKYKYIGFDEEVSYHNARTDPAGFVAGLPERVILDEVQRVPEIFPLIKTQVDRGRVPGRFLLTGSANVLLVPRLRESLAGRMQIVRLHPLAQSELERQTSHFFLDALFKNGFKIRQTGRMGKELCERIAAGGYPEAVRRSSGRPRREWYRSHVTTQMQRDALDIRRVASPGALAELLALAAAETSSLFNLSGLAAPFRLSRPTIDGYVRLLETVFLVERLPPWHSNRRKRLVKTPKIHIGDTGLACALLGVDAAGLEEDRPLLGQLLETFVFQELRRQASWHDDHMSFHHYRDRDGGEVDIVIERGTRAVAGVEVKASGTVTRKDFRGLRRLREAAGDRFTAGVVLYDGETSGTFGDGMYAVPLRFLWQDP